MNIEIYPWRPEDIDTLMEWVAKDRSILRNMRVPEDADDFEIRRMLVLGSRDPTQQRFMALRDGKPVAAIAVYDVRPDGKAFASIMANPEGSSGFATVASCKQMMQVLFNGFGLTEIQVVISEDNATALKLAKLMDFEDLNVRQLRLTKGAYEERSNGSSHGAGAR